MDPLSITASIVGILTAAAQVTAVLGKIKDAPKSIEDILIEMEHIQLIFRALQVFLNKASAVPTDRVALIQLEDVVVVLTRTVLVFSELEPLITKLSSKKMPFFLRHGVWMRVESGVIRLVRQLQRHKTSLALLLQIIQCESDLEARETAERLQQRMEQDAEINPNLPQRLESLQLQADTIEHENLGCRNAGSNQRSHDSDSRSNTPVQELSLTQTTPRSNHPESNSEAPHSDFSAEKSFDVVLSATRVYNRVQDGEIDMVTSVSTTRSRAWSILSGLSLSQISIIAVIKLPLYANELTQFQRLASQSSATFDTTVNNDDSMLLTNEEFRHDHSLVLLDDSIKAALCLYRLKEELKCMDIIQSCPCGDSIAISARPILYDLTKWKATIWGPDNTPYEGGIFSLSIIFGTCYPYEPPTIIFNTRVYHPNIDSYGHIPLDIMSEQWPSGNKIRFALLAVRHLLGHPNPDEPLVPEIAHVYKTDKLRYEETARKWTRKYADKKIHYIRMKRHNPEGYGHHLQVHKHPAVLHSDFNEMQYLRELFYSGIL